MFMPGANTANLLCSGEAGGGAWRNCSLLHQPLLKKTRHLTQLTCSHSAHAHVRKSKVEHGFSALGVFPSWGPHFFDPGAWGEWETISFLSSGQSMKQNEDLRIQQCAFCLEDWNAIMCPLAETKNFWFSCDISLIGPLSSPGNPSSWTFAQSSTFSPSACSHLSSGLILNHPEHGRYSLPALSLP